MGIAFFANRIVDGYEVLDPQPIAVSQWGRDQLRGMAVSGALARAAEQAVAETGRTDLRPARWNLDVFRPARAAPCRTAATIVRMGRRLCLVDAILEQGGRPVARGSVLLLAPSESAHGAVWSPPCPVAPPPSGLAPDPGEPRLYHSEGVGWTASPADHQNAMRKQTWHLPIPIVVDEEPSAFAFVACVADVVSVVAHWGDRGLEHINADVTLALARLPRVGELGLAAAFRAEEGGIAIASAHVFDREGVFGSALVTAIANVEHAIPLGMGDRQRSRPV